MDLQSPLEKQNLHKMFKVMLKLPLKHSSPPVNTVQNDGFSKCKQLGQNQPSIKFCKILGNTGLHWHLYEVWTNVCVECQSNPWGKKSKS